MEVTSIIVEQGEISNRIFLFLLADARSRRDEVPTSATTYFMTFQTFKEYVFHRDEGTWLPNKPIVASMGKINPFPISQGRRGRLVAKPVKARHPGIHQTDPVANFPVSQSDFAGFRVTAISLARSQWAGLRAGRVYRLARLPAADLDRY